MTEPLRKRQIVTALTDEIERQGATGRHGLDVQQLAVAVLDALGHDGSWQSPLDPEGDGLTPPELNATNDV